MLTRFLLSTMVAFLLLAPSRILLAQDSLNGLDPNKILGSKHDFVGLNKRTGVVAMPGVAFSDYGNSCIYCHLPDNIDPKKAGEAGANAQWNRFIPSVKAYQLYDSRTLNNKVRSPNAISLLCLSCHDGTMGLDMTVFKPDGWKSSEDAALHLRLNGNDDLNSCGKCHNGKVAHSIEIKHIGTDLTNDHPISMSYAGLNHKDHDFAPVDSPLGFDNGVRLYNGQVECASCHNVHNPDVKMLLRVKAGKLCETCHLK